MPPMDVIHDPHCPTFLKSPSDILHTVKLGPNNNLLGSLPGHLLSPTNDFVLQNDRDFKKTFCDVR